MKSDSHKSAQKKAAGKDGYTEYPLSKNRRLDALTKDKKRATEVELCGNLKNAVQRLKDSGAPQKVLQVRQEDMEKACKAMRGGGVKGTVKNLSGTKRKSV